LHKQAKSRLGRRTSSCHGDQGANQLTVANREVLRTELQVEVSTVRRNPRRPLWVRRRRGGIV
jgi:hypothetical protein